MHKLTSRLEINKKDKYYIFSLYSFIFALAKSFTYKKISSIIMTASIFLEEITFFSLLNYL